MSASVAHSAVRTPEPVTEGYVSLLEPFIDTIVICTITALVIGTSQVADPNFAGQATGVAMTSAAFERQLSWFPLPLAFAALLFAFSTMISWSYYGDRAVTYLTGGRGVLGYRILYVAGFVVASFADTTIIWTISELTIALMTIPNLFGIIFLSREMKSTIKNYWVDFKKDWPDVKTPE